jgi:hypothetical protein
LFLASAPQLESGPRQPAGYDHQAIGEKYQRNIGGFRLTEKFDNPTLGFAVFVVGVLSSFGHNYERGKRISGAELVSSAPLAALATLLYAIISITSE